MPTIAISGAGSGIGHTFLKHFSSDEAYTIHAIDRSWSDEITDGDAKASVRHHTVDTSSQTSVNEFALELKSQPIDLFIHSAAVRGLVAAGAATMDGSDPGALETMEVMDVETLNSTLQINITGSFLLIRALVPNLKAAKKGMVVVMGSRMGSIGANKDGRAYAYRASKAGLNAVVKSFSLDVPEVCFVTIHPGRVESRMTPQREEGAVDAEEAIKEMMKLIEGFGKDDSGSFYTREGEGIPW